MSTADSMKTPPLANTNADSGNSPSPNLRWQDTLTPEARQAASQLSPAARLVVAKLITLKVMASH